MLIINMKVLIVNGYSSNYNGQKKFNEFVAAIKEVPTAAALLNSAFRYSRVNDSL